MVGIIGASSSAINGLKQDIENGEIFTVAGMDFLKGKLYGKDVVVVMSGMGKVNAAICTQILIMKFSADVVINTGVAGALNSDLDVLDIVISRECMEHDMDATVIGYDKGTVPMTSKSVLKADEKLVDLAYECAKEVLPNVKAVKGKVLTGDQFIGTEEKKEELVEDFNGDCVDMAGAAVAYTANINGAKFVIIRTMSDNADGGADLDYPAFEKLAAKNSITLIKEILKSL